MESHKRRITFGRSNRSLDVLIVALDALVVVGLVYLALLMRW